MQQKDHDEGGRSGMRCGRGGGGEGDFMKLNKFTFIITGLAFAGWALLWLWLWTEEMLEVN